MWINKKYKCKGTMKTSPSLEGEWIDQFVEGKWYDCQYNTWSHEEEKNKLYCRLNGGWDGYKSISESGVEIELSRAEFNVVFYVDYDEIREQLIDEILS